MSAVAFDTLKYAKRLKEAGFTEQQAEALASAQVDLIEANLATKADIFGLKRDLKDLEGGLKRDLKELEHRLVAKLYRALLIQTFALAGLVGTVVVIALRVVK
jgi:hypothetical protein